MAGPLSGIAGQQVPFATTFKPGSQQETPTAQQRQDEATGAAANGQTQAQATESTSAPVSQGSESNRSQNDGSRNTGESFSAANNNSDSGETRRGSILDIAV